MKKLVMLLVSEHNVAEYESCLYLKPDEIWLFRTPQMDEPAKRLQQQLQAHLPKQTRIEQLPNGHYPSAGESASELQQWGNEWLHPEIAKRQREGWHCILNITGGTKLMPLILKESAAWDELHYNPFNQQQSQIYDSHNRRWRVEVATQDATIEAQLKLYMNRIEVKHDWASLEQLKPAEAMAVAELLHQASLDDYHGKVHPWQMLVERILNGGQSLWHGWRGDLLFTHSINASTYESLQPLCKILNSLANKDFIQLEPHQLTLPTAKHKPSAAWRKFIDGGWFEFLINEWLKGCPTPLEILRNVELYPAATTKEMANKREADLIVRSGKQLTVIELKADSTHPLQESGQLESLKNSGGGKFDTLLLYSPQSYRHIKDPLAFSQRVLNSRSRIGLALNPEAVYELVNRKDFSNWPNVKNNAV